jgi:hypothetical protein
MATAIAVENFAKITVMEGGTHRAGTKTPASPGSGPALITGQLRRSISHAEVVGPAGVFAVRIGPADTARDYQNRGKGAHARRAASSLGFALSGTGKRGTSLRSGHSGTTNGRVGLALETGLRNGTKYPFLYKAFKQGITTKEAIWREGFDRGSWRA